MDSGVLFDFSKSIDFNTKFLDAPNSKSSENCFCIPNLYKLLKRNSSYLKSPNNYKLNYENFILFFKLVKDSCTSAQNHEKNVRTFFKTEIFWNGIAYAENLVDFKIMNIIKNNNVNDIINIFNDKYEFMIDPIFKQVESKSEYPILTTSSFKENTKIDYSKIKITKKQLVVEQPVVVEQQQPTQQVEQQPHSINDYLYQTPVFNIKRFLMDEVPYYRDSERSHFPVAPFTVDSTDCSGAELEEINYLDQCVNNLIDLAYNMACLYFNTDSVTERNIYIRTLIEFDRTLDNLGLQLFETSKISDIAHELKDSDEEKQFDMDEISKLD